MEPLALANPNLKLLGHRESVASDGRTAEAKFAPPPRPGRPSGTGTRRGGGKRIRTVPSRAGATVAGDERAGSVGAGHEGLGGLGENGGGEGSRGLAVVWAL